MEPVLQEIAIINPSLFIKILMEKRVMTRAPKSLKSDNNIVVPVPDSKQNNKFTRDSSESLFFQQHGKQSIY
jgi:hypothetical protein